MKPIINLRGQSDLQRKRLTRFLLCLSLFLLIASSMIAWYGQVWWYQNRQIEVASLGATDLYNRLGGNLEAEILHQDLDSPGSVTLKIGNGFYTVSAHPEDPTFPFQIKDETFVDRGVCGVLSNFDTMSMNDATMWQPCIVKLYPNPVKGEMVWNEQHGWEFIIHDPEVSKQVLGPHKNSLYDMTSDDLRTWFGDEFEVIDFYDMTTCTNCPSYQFVVVFPDQEWYVHFTDVAHLQADVELSLVLSCAGYMKYDEDSEVWQFDSTSCYSP